MHHVSIGIIAAILCGVLPLIWLIYYLIKQQKRTRETQRHISDRELLRLLGAQPDRLLSPHQLRDLTGITLNDARARLNALHVYGILRRSYNSRGRHFFSPRDPVEEPPTLDLSPDPFLTVEDLLQIFMAYDYRVTAQQMIMATGLPLTVIKRELKYFEDQDIVQKLQRSDGNGTVMHRFFVLKDPYRTDPERFRQRAETLDGEMRKILVDEKLLV